MSGSLDVADSQRRRHSSEDVWTKNVDKSELADLENLASTRGEVLAPSEGGKAFSWRTLWAYTGPGWLMSIAYLDPGNLEGDLQAGAYGGYELIWVLFWCTVMGLVLQMLAARLGVVTGLNLAEMCRLEYPRPVSLALWVMTEIAIVGSDIQEVIGSAIAFKILFNWPLWVGCLVTGFDTFSFLAIHALGIRKLEAFFAFLIGTMLVAFFYDFAESNPPGDEIMKGFEPLLHNYAVIQAVGLVGAVIMPHNIYLHSALVQSRKVDRKDAEKVAEANKYFSIEAAVALAVSFLINLTVVAVFAYEFFDPTCASKDTTTACVPDSIAQFAGKHSYGVCTTPDGGAGSCREIGLDAAGDALHGVLGSSARIVWAIGLLAAGQSSTMTGTFAGQYVMEGFLQMKIAPWKRVAFTRSIALGPAIIVALASQSNETVNDELGEWLNVLQSVQLPFALLPVLHFTGSRRLMGQFACGRVTKVVCWALALLVLVINVYLVVDFVTDENNPVPHETWFYIVVLLIGVLYFGFVGIVAREDLREFYAWVTGNEYEEWSQALSTPLIGNGEGREASVNA